MVKKIANSFYIIIFIFFIFLILKYYLSEKNIILINKSRSSYSLNLNLGKENLLLLKNDTNNIIIYKNDLEEFKKKRKKRFWEELISN